MRCSISSNFMFFYQFFLNFEQKISLVTLLLFFRWYICIRNCWLECERLPLVGNFAPRSRTSSLGTCSTPSYTGDHLAPQLFWACWHRWWSDQGADEGVGSAGVRGSEDLRRTSSGCLVSGTCTQALAQAQAQAVSSQVIAHKVFQPGRCLSLFTFLYISCVHQASFYVSPLFLCLRL